jgi:S1-C subfamily serine protease
MFRTFVNLGIFHLSALFSLAQTTTTEMLNNTLPGVVTVAVYETDIAMKVMGFRGSSIDAAYSKVLDLSGAEGTGSGFIIKRNNAFYVITNAHVIENASDQRGAIFVYSINQTKYEARFVGGDSFYDVAVLEFMDPPGAELIPLDFRITNIDLGEQVYAIGNPLSIFPYSVSEGIISGKNRVRDGLTGKFGFLQTTATIIWGNSGGPLVDSKGRVAGINSQIAFTERDDQRIWQPQINFALESDISKQLVDDIISNNGLIKRAYFGFEISSARPFSYYNIDDAVGKEMNPKPVLSDILPGSPLLKQLAPYIGHEIISINSEAVRNVQEVLGVLEKVKPGQEIKITFANNGVQKDVGVKPESNDGKRTSVVAAYVLNSWECKTGQDKTGY